MPAAAPAASRERAASVVRPAAQRERMRAEMRPLPPASAGSDDAVAAVEMAVAATSLEPERVGGGSEEVSICKLAGARRRS